MSSHLPLFYSILPYVVAGGILWIIACETAPLGREIKLSRGLAAAILMGLCSMASTEWLMPLMGYWHFLVVLAAWVLIARLMFEFSFRRSFTVALMYFVVMIGVQTGIRLLANPKSLA